MTYQKTGGHPKGKNSQKDNKKVVKYDNEDDLMTNVFDYGFDDELNDIGVVILVLPSNYAEKEVGIEEITTVSKFESSSLTEIFNEKY